MIVADTNVVSEFMKDTPDPAVFAWAETLGSEALTICVVTVEEIERGLGRLPPGRRRQHLEQRWSDLVGGYAEGILLYDLEAARRTAKVLVASAESGRPMALADAQIAGICLAGGHRLATRNTRDFEGTPGLTIVNPFR